MVTLLKQVPKVSGKAPARSVRPAPGAPPIGLHLGVLPDPWPSHRTAEPAFACPVELGIGERLSELEGHLAKKWKIPCVGIFLGDPSAAGTSPNRCPRRPASPSGKPGWRHRRSDRTFCGAALAWAIIAVPAC